MLSVKSGMLPHAFNPSIPVAKAGIITSVELVWVTEKTLVSKQESSIDVKIDE